MNISPRIIGLFFLGAAATAPVSALADHPDPAAEKSRDNAVRPPKPTLAVAATLDHNGRLWVARVENHRLLVSWSDNEGMSFSVPVVITPEPENIAADGESRPKIAVARDGSVLLTWVQSL